MLKLLAPRPSAFDEVISDTDQNVR
jgi:hypothetical protein